jgi:hypothetical protein
MNRQGARFAKSNEGFLILVIGKLIPGETWQ